MRFSLDLKGAQPVAPFTLRRTFTNISRMMLGAASNRKRPPFTSVVWPQTLISEAIKSLTIR